MRRCTLRRKSSHEFLDREERDVVTKQMTVPATATRQRKGRARVVDGRCIVPRIIVVVVVTFFAFFSLNDKIKT